MAGFGFGIGGFATGLTNGMQAGIGIRRAQQERQLNQMKLLQLQRQQEVDQEGQQAADATRQAIASGQVQLKDAGTYFATHFAPKLALSYMALGKPELAKGILAWSDQAENKEIINKMATLAGAINWAKTSGNLAPAKEAMRSLYNGLPAQLTGGAKFQDLTISKGPNGKVNGYSAIFSGPDGKRFKKSWPDLNSMIQETEGYLHPSAYMERLHSAGLLNALGPSAPSAQPQSAAPAAQATPAPNAALLSPQPTETVPAQLSGGTTTDIPAAVPAGSPVADATTITAPQSVAAIAPALVGGVPQGTSAVPPVAPRLPVNAPPVPPVQVASSAQELPSPAVPDQTPLPTPPMPPESSGAAQATAPQLPMPQATPSPDAQVSPVPTRPAELPAAPASTVTEPAQQPSQASLVPPEQLKAIRSMLYSGDPKLEQEGRTLLAQYLKPSERKFGPIGRDAMGQPLYGFVDTRTGQVTPYQTTPAAEAAAEQPGHELHGQAFLDTLPGNIANQVKALAQGRLQFPGSFALRSPYWQKMITMVSQYDPTFDAINYTARSGTRKDFTSGKAAQAITSFNMVIGHLGTLDKAIEGLHNSAYPWWNRFANWASVQGGDQKFQAEKKTFDTARQAVADELTRAFRLVGGNVHDIQAWESNINSADSPVALHAVVKQAIDLLHSRLEALADQYNRGMGTTKDPLDLVSPKARKVIERLSNESFADVETSPTGRGAMNSPPVQQPSSPQSMPNRQMPTASGSPPHINTKAQYDALPSGTVYVAPDGTTRVKR